MQLFIFYLFIYLFIYLLFIYFSVVKIDMSSLAPRDYTV